VLSERYEVRCHHCDCSFAPGTKRCVHCGERLGGFPAGLSLARSPGGAHEEAEVQVPGFARVALWIGSALVAILISALQVCAR
jgi:hypothetical protein